MCGIVFRQNLIKQETQDLEIDTYNDSIRHESICDVDMRKMETYSVIPLQHSCERLRRRF